MFGLSTVILLTLVTIILCLEVDHTSAPMLEPPLKGDAPRVLTREFQHRYSFNHGLGQPQHQEHAFDLIDTATLVASDTAKSLKLARFTLRAHIHENTPLLQQQNSRYVPGVSDEANDPGQRELKPNTTDKETVVNLAKMTSDAYLFDPREPDWLNTSLGFNFTSRFGWFGDGLRGHVFSTEDYSTVVVSFKGTTIDPRDKLSGRDRINDNRLFSCCCGNHNPYRYAPVCNCSTGQYQCNSACLTKSLLQNDTYYDAAIYVMGKIQEMYPKATFWTVGHSLGGSLASLVGLTFNIPAVTFEAPPERLPAERMGLLPLNTTTKTETATIHHFGNSADPVFMGTCNGFFSSCSAWGFTFESQCFSGKRCLYDTVKDKGWRSSINNHRINNVIQNVLEAYEQVPTCEDDSECSDCSNWNFSLN